MKGHLSKADFFFQRLKSEALGKEVALLIHGKSSRVQRLLSLAPLCNWNLTLDCFLSCLLGKMRSV